MKTKKETIYITKYALTKGIITAKASVDGPVARTDGPIVTICAKSQILWGDEWHYSADKAIAYAEEMRDKAIKEAEKKIAKLKALSFDCE